MNGRTRKKWYMIISKRDGKFCHNCEKLPSQGQLVIDHIDNNNDNNSADNLQLLCRACNYKKNPRGEPVDMCVSEEKKREDSISINQDKEPKFRDYVYAEIKKERRVLLSDLVASGAEVLGISIETAKRYLSKMISNAGKLERVPSWDSGWVVQFKNPLDVPEIVDKEL